MWWFVLLWVSAAPAFAVAVVDDALRLQGDGEPILAFLHTDGSELRSREQTREFYARRDHRPAWVHETGLGPAAQTLLERLANAGSEGLRPAYYHQQPINRVLAAAVPGTPFPPLQSSRLDVLLTDAFLTYASHLLSGHSRIRVPQYRTGLKPRSRDLPILLQQALDADRIAQTFDDLEPARSGYRRLKRVLAHYRTLQRRGGWPCVSPGPKLELHARGLRVRELRQRLAVSGELTNPDDRGPEQTEETLLQVAATAGWTGAGPGAGGTEGASEYLFDAELDEAVRRFQRRHGLLVDGIVGRRTLAALNVPIAERIRQLEVNLERLRWLPESLGERYVLVNIPAFRMRIMEAGSEVLAASVIVGRRGRPTPLLSGVINHLVLSPRWHVPYSIAVKDKLPLLRRDPYALFRQGIRIYDARGRGLDPGAIDWTKVSRKNFPYRLRQDPGSANALGQIKFMFPNPHQVYLHDTPQKSLFRRSQRAFSSGCVRVSKPFEMAEYLLRDKPRWDRAAIVAASRGKRERYVTLSEKIPVHIVYWTAWADEGDVVHFRSDIYRRDRSLAKALSSG